MESIPYHTVTAKKKGPHMLARAGPSVPETPEKRVGVGSLPVSALSPAMLRR
jgi:hypothetical protein